VLYLSMQGKRGKKILPKAKVKLYKDLSFTYHIMENRKYPIGPFDYGQTYTFQDVRKGIERIAKLPKQLKKVLKKAKSVELDKKYRPGGWTARQVIHHIADSHINAYTRFKLAMTEEHPTIRPYNEQAWAELSDGSDAGVRMSLDIIESVHKRLCYFLESMTESDFERTYFHPESKRTFKLAEVVALYAWHGKHHLKHIELALEGDKASDENDIVETKGKKVKSPEKSEKKEKVSESKASKVSETKKSGISEPKKRGRKPGTVAKTTVGKATEVKATKVSTKAPQTVVVGVSEPKKRGRKPGTVAKTTVEKATEVKATKVSTKAPKAVVAGVSEPKKRGRKPGTTVKTTVVKTTAVKTPKAPKAIAVASEPKKRGRKPGSSSKTITVTKNMQTALFASTATEIKPRGRKPGTVVEKVTVIKAPNKVTTTTTTFAAAEIHGQKPELIINRVTTTEKKKPGPKPKK
jgi:DinB superfamily